MSDRRTPTQSDNLLTVAEMLSASIDKLEIENGQLRRENQRLRHDLAIADALVHGQVDSIGKLDVELQRLRDERDEARALLHQTRAKELDALRILSNRIHELEVESKALQADALYSGGVDTIAKLEQRIEVLEAELFCAHLVFVPGDEDKANMSELQRLRQQVAELQAAGEWQPVKCYRLQCNLNLGGGRRKIVEIEIVGHSITMRSSDGDAIAIYAPDIWACRRTPAAQEDSSDDK